MNKQNAKIAMASIAVAMLLLPPILQLNAPVFAVLGYPVEWVASWIFNAFIALCCPAIAGINFFSKTHSPAWYWFSALAGGVIAIWMFFATAFSGAQIVGI